MAWPAPTNLTIETRDGYLYVEYSGDVLTLDAIVTTINSVAAAIRADDVKRVLIVRNAPLLTDDAARALVASMVRQAVPYDVRFAIVDKFGNDPAEARQAADASRDAGWNLTGFDTIEEAVAWLRKE